MSIDRQLLEKSNMTTERRHFFVRTCDHLYALSSAFVAKEKSSTDAERAQHGALLTFHLKRTPFIFSDDESRAAAHLTLLRAFYRYNQVRHDKAPLPPALESVMTSGFLTYCLDGYPSLASLTLADLDKLEAMTKNDKAPWPDLEDFLTPDQLSEIQTRRRELIGDIQTSRLDIEHQTKRLKKTAKKRPPLTDSSASSGRKARNRSQSSSRANTNTDSTPPYSSNESFNQSMRNQLAEANALIERLSKKQ